jgi:hypothetical protein
VKKVILALGIAGSVASIVGIFNRTPASTNFLHAVSQGSNSPVQTFYGGNNTINSITTTAAPPATATPGTETYVDEWSARADLDFALDIKGDLHEARAVLNAFPPSAAKEEECQRTFQYAIKHSRRNDADAIAHECFTGRQLFDALAQVKSIHTQEN